LKALELLGMNVVTYRDLGVRRVVNGGGTYTILGGSLMSPEVIEAMDEAARHFVLIDELYDKAGRFLAEIIGSESAYVTSGAAAGLVLAWQPRPASLQKMWRR
jgi:L-seryl-tRNA(Ser) seleniumtransferase